MPGESLQVSSAREPVRMLRCSREKELSVVSSMLSSYVFTVCAGRSSLPSWAAGRGLAVDGAGVRAMWGCEVLGRMGQAEGGV